MARDTWRFFERCVTADDLHLPPDNLQITPHEMLARRSDVQVLRIDADKRKDSAERARLLNAADVAFLCLPDAAAREAWSRALVDLPTDAVRQRHHRSRRSLPLDGAPVP